MKISQKGLIILVVGIAINALFRALAIGGLLIELSRIVILVGIVIAVAGVIKKR